MRQTTAPMIGVALAALAMTAAPASAAPCAAGKLVGQAALTSDWAYDRPGRCREIRPSDLRGPTASHVSRSKIKPIPAGTLPKVPKGFKVTRFFHGSDQPRLIRTAP